MAMTPQVFGPCLVRLGGADFGYTRNGADVNDDAKMLDVPGDEGGGDEGVPIDIQYLGSIVRIRLEMTRWDSAKADLIAARVSGATAGTPAPAGTLMFAASKTYRLTLVSQLAGGAVMNFPRAVFRQPIEINKGTKYSRLVLEGEAHKDANGVLYNATN